MKNKNFLIFFITGIVAVSLTALFGIWKIKTSTAADTQVNIQNILNDINYLSSDAVFQPLQYRVAGTEGEKMAAKYILGTFSKNGYDVKEQRFTFYEIIKENVNSIDISFQGGPIIHPTTSEIHSNQNINQTIRGKLVNFGKGSILDYEQKKDLIDGNFILMQVDESTSMDYFSSLEFNQRVKGIIVYAPNFEAPTEPVIANKFVLEKSNLYGEDFMTITTITLDDYQTLIKEVDKNPDLEISEKISYDVAKDGRKSQNIIATKEGQGANRPLIIIGAHYDSINAPGADDNASGVAALMELGRILSTKNLDYDMKLVAFGAEEAGLLGSNSFVSELPDEELRRCKLMINIDGPGVGNVLVIGKSTGENPEVYARTLAFQAAENNHYYYKIIEFPDSDQFHFSQAGIPTITFASLKSLSNVPLLFLNDTEYHNFSDLEKENIIIPQDNHSLNDTYDLIEESNKINSNFEKLFKVLFGVLNSSEFIER